MPSITRENIRKSFKLTEAPTLTGLSPRNSPLFSFKFGWLGPIVTSMILNSDHEKRLLYFSLTNVLAIIVVAVSTPADLGYSLENSRTCVTAAGFLMLQFFIFISTLLYFSPKECVRSLSPLYVCGSLCITEFLIGGLSLGSSGAFITRGVSYILVGTVALLESSDIIQWTIFRLLGAIILEIGTWVLLILIQLEMNSLSTLIILTHHSVVSVGLSLPLWIMLYFHMLGNVHSTPRKPDTSSSRRHVDIGSIRRPLDFLASQPPQESLRVQYNIDANASLIRSPQTNQESDDHHKEDDDSFVHQHGSKASLLREAMKDLLHQQIMSGVMVFLHLFITLLVILAATGVISADMENTVYAVVVSPMLGLWQVGKVFLQYGWELSEQNVKYLLKVQRAHRDTIQTVQRLTSELKWPLGALRGIRLEHESPETVDTLKKATRSLIWLGHLMRMHELGNEALVLKTINRRRVRKIAIQHLIKTVVACLGCQTSSTVKDLHTTVSVNEERLTRVHVDGFKTETDKDRPQDVHVVANQDLLLYGLLSMHALIVSLADPHQELRMDFVYERSSDGNEAILEAKLHHWGQCPEWSVSSDPANGPASIHEGADLDWHSSALIPAGLKGSGRKLSNKDERDIHLSIVENIRAVIGGTIQSTMRGRMCETVFQVTLPTKSAALKLKRNVMKRSANKCVLLVEDSQVTRKIMKKHIEAVWPGSEIEECQNGEEAIVRVAHLGQERFDIIFLDYYLGTEKEMTGVQLCMKLRQYAARTMIIGVTGDGNGIALPDFLLNGADLVFLKPITRKMLAEVFDKDDEESVCSHHNGSSKNNNNKPNGGVVATGDEAMM